MNILIQHMLFFLLDVFNLNTIHIIALFVLMFFVYYFIELIQQGRVSN